MATVTIDRETARQELARRRFLDFLDYVKIQDPPVPGKFSDSAIIKLEKWPHLVEIANLLVTKVLLVILKARQVGVSWLIAAYALWYASYKPGSVVFLFSKGEYEAQVLLGKLKTVYRYLPPQLQVEFEAAPSLSELKFNNGSKIKAFASTQDAGRSETASIVLYDEADYHPWLQENFTATKPTRDAGGQMIMVSTSDKLRVVSTFKNIYKGGTRSDGAPPIEGRANGWTRYFIGWAARPGRDGTWYDSTKYSVPATERLTPEQYMEQEYPGTEEEALAPSRVASAFDLDVLKEMLKDVRDPLLGISGLPTFGHAYQLFSPGTRLAAFTDTSHGVQQDYAVTAVMNVQTGYTVADVFSNRISPQELGFQSVELLRQYGNPLWAIEDNDWGAVTIDTAQRLGYRNLWRDPDKKDRVGFHTDSGRFMVWGELIEAVKARQIVVPSKEGLNQFFSVIRNSAKQGRIEAMEGSHDDYPFAVGGCWYMRRFVHTGSASTAPVYRPRW